MLIFSFTFSKGGIIDTIEKEKNIRDLKSKIEKLKTENKQKQKQIEMLNKNEDYRKSIIKGLGIEIEENEYIFRFNSKNSLPANQEKIEYQSQKILSFIIPMFILQIIIITLIFLKPSRN